MRKFVLAYKFTTNIPAKLTSLGAARSFSRMKLEFPPMKLKFLTYETRVSYLGNWSFIPRKLKYAHEIGGVKSEVLYLCRRMSGERTRQELRNTYPIVYQLWIYITKTYDVTTVAEASVVGIVR